VKTANSCRLPGRNTSKGENWQIRVRVVCMAKKVKLPDDYIKFLKEKGLSLSEIKARLFFEFDIEVSRATIWRRLRE
jgi:transposase